MAVHFLQPKTVRLYVREHPEKTFSELERVFRPELQGASGVIRSLKYLQLKDYKGSRFFMDAGAILRSSDGIDFAVCTQWSYHNTPNFAAHARELGFVVEKSH